MIRWVISALIGAGIIFTLATGITHNYTGGIVAAGCWIILITVLALTGRSLIP